MRQIVAYLIFYMLNAKIIKTKLKDLATFLEVICLQSNILMSYSHSVQGQNVLYK